MSLAKLFKMRSHPIRKFCILFVIYTVVIVGIFILQFRSESVISRSIGAMHVTVAETQTSANTTALKNRFQVAFHGLTITSDDTIPIVLTYKDSHKENLVLDKFDITSDTSCAMQFVGGTALVFTATGSESSSLMEINAIIPQNAVSLELNYKTTNGYSVLSSTAKQIIFSSQRDSYSLRAEKLSENSITFFENEGTARYAYYDPSSQFSFDTLISNPISSKKTLDTTIQSLKNDLIQLFNASLASDSSSLTEDSIVAYISERAIRNEYDEAINEIPTAFKRNSKRTFKTTPYLGSLISMNRSLVIQTNNYNSLLAQAVVSNTLDIFTVTNIAPYLLTLGKDENVVKLLSIPNNLEKFEPTLEQAAGIISFYNFFYKENKEYASIIETKANECLGIIEKACQLDNGRVIIKEKEASLPLLQAAIVGKALMDYGSAISRPEITAAGRAILSTYLENSSSLDLRTLTELYYIVTPDNTYIPHIKILDKNAKDIMWAWTVANDISISKTSTSISYKINFPQTKSHYMIINNVEPFDEIEIYGLKYHTDPRFESYNSSGYSYNKSTKTLFIKSRHKSPTEVIKLIYNTPVVSSTSE
ncbi:MAG: hypothetical protein K6F69_01280 [Treponema sp.]|nr:hypothetical protein [Treponema sp.]